MPHEGGFAAVGSTGENAFAEPFATDGLRPKAIGRDPLVGPLPDHTRIVALTGGFKISFGVAHRLADSALDAVFGTENAPLPPSFTVGGQLSALR